MKRPELLLTMAIAATLTAAAQSSPIVQTRIETGVIRGDIVENNLAIYKAVPYAAPPVGDLRWKAPQPHQPWAGTYHADDFGPWPPQPNPKRGPMPPPMDEDCLYLSVLTPATSTTDRLPVLVWIHGGGFQTDAYCEDTFYPLAHHGIIVVNIEYRTGVLGFMAHPALSKESAEGHSGNYGLLDQIFALKWIQKNIAAFGGNPENVTIAGESAGAMSVCILCASPLTKGLFRRAISHSGGSFYPVSDTPGGRFRSLTQRAEEQHGMAFQKHMKCRSIKQLRKVDAKSLTDEHAGMYGFRPCVDGYVITGDNYLNYQQGRYNDMPLIIMTNSDEGAMFSQDMPRNAYLNYLKNTFGSFADEAFQLYPGNTPEEIYSSVCDISREAFFAWPSFAWASLQTATGHSPVYTAYLAQPSTYSLIGTKKRKGVSHADDILYFKNVYSTQPEQYPHEAAVAEIMQQYWVNFVTSGNPNAKGLPYWPSFNADEATTMQFSNGATLIKVPNRRNIDFFDRFMRSQRETTRQKADPRVFP